MDKREAQIGGDGTNMREATGSICRGNRELTPEEAKAKLEGLLAGCGTDGLSGVIWALLEDNESLRKEIAGLADICQRQSRRVAKHVHGQANEVLVRQDFFEGLNYPEPAIGRSQAGLPRGFNRVLRALTAEE